MYPTASAPQYAFGPSLAPVPMPGMVGGGLAALANQYRKGGRIKYFEDGGDSSDGGDDGGGGGGNSSTDGSGGAGGDSGAGIGADGGSAPSEGGGPGGADSSAEGGAGAAFGGTSETQSAAQSEIGNQAVTDALAEAALAGPLGAQVTAEAQEAEADQAATNAAALGAQANAIAAEIAAQQEEDAKTAAMVEAMNNPQAPTQAAPAFGISFQNPFNMNPTQAFGMFSPFATVTTPMGPVSVSPMDVAAPAMGKAAQAVNAGVNVGRAAGFAEGGIASLANQVQSKGRGQDTMLVHMTPGEVKGLQALAMSQGGSLTINPQTGLPEAGFLSSLLPMIAGFALGPAGFALMSAPMAGLTVGALTGIATGSLKKGLMAGLGAYGGAGLGQGLVSAATPVEGAIPAPVETAFGSVSSPEASMLNPTLDPTSGIQVGQVPPSTSQISPISGSETSFPVKDKSFADLGTDYEPFSPIKDRAYAQLPPPPMVQPTGLQGAASGIENMFQTGPAGTAARSAFMKGAPTGSLMAAGTTTASALTPEPTPLQKPVSNIRPFSLDITNPSGTPQYTPQDTREREQVRYTYSPQPIYQAAQGGMMDLMRGGSYDDEIGKDDDFAYAPGGDVKKAKSRSLKGNPYYKFADNRKDSSMEAAIEQNFAKGGMKDVLPPRFLQGAGDGMSDSIKARIGGMQEARLADGEFVVPADVVSHLGNGSSKAGAKKLYAMMDKIRKARTGRTRQAPEVNPNKYMPA